MNYLKKYLKYKKKYLDLKLQQGGDNNYRVNEEYDITDPKYLDLKLQQGGDNNCGVNPDYGSRELLEIVRRWYEQREVSWSSGQKGYYLMHMARTGRNVNCTNFNDHIHLISVDVNNENILRIMFSQKIYSYPVRISQILIDKLLDLIKTNNYTEIDNYLIKEQFSLSSIMTHGSDRNKTYKLENYDHIWQCLYTHSLIGDRIRQLLDSGQLRIYDQYCGVNPDYGSRELLEIVRRWYEQREVSWSSGQKGYYLMHMARTGFNLGVNCTDFNNHIHLISADINGTSLDIIFSQKIYGYPVQISEKLIDKLIHSVQTDNYTEIDNYLIREQFTLGSIMAHDDDEYRNRNKTYVFKKDDPIDHIWQCLYTHSLIGDRIRQLLDSGQLRIYLQFGTN